MPKKQPTIVMFQDLFGETFTAKVGKQGGKPILKDIERAREKDKKPTIPEAGQVKFFVLCDRVTLYTSIGADNVHHASNKATKLFGPNWSKVTTEPFHCRGYEFISVPKFAQLIKSLPN